MSRDDNIMVQIVENLISISKAFIGINEYIEILIKRIETLDEITANLVKCVDRLNDTIHEELLGEKEELDDVAY